MVKKLILSAAIIILAVFLGIFLSWRYSSTHSPSARQPEETYSASGSDVRVAENESERPAAEDTPEEDARQAPEEPTVSTGYYLRDHEGRIAIFPANSEIPEMVFDVYTRMLPESDQELLRQGVYVADYEELTRLIEDYIS